MLAVKLRWTLEVHGRVGRVTGTKKTVVPIRCVVYVALIFDFCVRKWLGAGRSGWEEPIQGNRRDGGGCQHDTPPYAAVKTI